jgi:uncharacterized protein with HEPN domain
MNHKTRNRLLVVVGYVDRIASTIKRAETLDNFLVDYDLQYSIAHSISQIVESLAQVLEMEPALAESLLQAVPYKSIKRMRDKIQHHYGSIDPDIVWAIANQNVPVLKEAIQQLLESPEQSQR